MQNKNKERRLVFSNVNERATVAMVIAGTLWYVGECTTDVAMAHCVI